MCSSIKLKQVSSLIKLIKDKCLRAKPMDIYSNLGSILETTDLTIKRMDLIEFLKCHNNYKRLDQFLSSCFAKENLDFISKCVVFHNMLLSKLSTIEISKYRQSRYGKNDEFLNKLYNIKFDYLKDLNSYYSQKLEENKMHQILNEIKTEYILESAVSSINISWEVRSKLIDFFNNYQNDESNKYLCLSIMNEALFQIYDGLDALYINYYG